MKRLILIAALFAANYAYAQSNVLPEPQRADTMQERKPSIGIRSGIGNVEGDDDQSWEYGVEIGYQPYIPFAVAVELSGMTSEGEGPDAGLTRTKLLGKGTYNFGGTTPVIRYSYVGAGLGPVLDNRNNDQDWNLGFSPTLGFDYPLKTGDKQFSIGATVAYLLVTGDNPDTLSANGMLKYWF